MLERLVPAGTILATPLLFLMAVQTTDVCADSTPDDALLGERIRAHIEFLADDSLRGRQPGTDGYTIAANYVASQFQQLGLKPAGDDGTFFQQVPLRRAWLEQSAVTLLPGGSERKGELEFLQDYYSGPSLAHTASEIKAPLVFAGYGIQAPLLDHDDFADLDVDGKIVLSLFGQPSDFPSEEGAHFASGQEKMRAAVSAGAVGLVTIFTPRTEQQFQWNRVNTMAGMPSMNWLTPEGEVLAAPAQIEGSVVLHHSAAGALFDGALMTLNDLLQLDEQGDEIPAFVLNSALQMSQRSRHEIIQSPNVVAVLPGTDPTLAAEVIAYTAHLDHLGELSGEGHDDAINNGALDNASGVAVMLETARILARNPPRRSILFVAVTAEEKGLVGSEYYARHPTVGEGAIVSVINLDMPLLLWDFGDVIAFGASHSSMGATVKQAAAEFGIALTPDPFPEQNLFVRSDHYRFVQQGIPSIFLVTGPTEADGVTDVMPMFEGFLKEHYHRPSDEFTLPIHYPAAAKFTKINSRIGEILANDSETPVWNEGDFFGDTFSR